MVIKSKNEEVNSNNSFTKVISWINHLERDQREVMLAVIVGFLGGIGAFILRVFIYVIFVIFISFPISFFGAFLTKILPIYANFLVIPIVLLSVTLGGAIVGYLNKIFPPEKGDHGIPQAINAVENNQGILPYHFPLISLIKSVITIGTGGSTGREGPIVQIGSGSGSAIGRFFKIPAEEKKVLIMAGVASGISATFNAPIGGLMFSFELFRRGEKSPPLLPLLDSSVVGSSVGLILIGNKTFLDFSNHVQLNYQIGDFMTYILMGFILGLISVFWIIGFHTIAGFFEHLKISYIVKGAIGGFTLGLIYVFVLFINIFFYGTKNFIPLPVWIDIPAGQSFPKYLSNAVNSMNSALNPNIGLLVLVAIIIFCVAFIGNGITLGSGGSGGLLAPTLLMGLMLGVIFNVIFAQLNRLGLDFFSSNIALLEFLALAAFFGGSTRLPMTAIIMTAEIVGDFQITIPLMFAVASAWIISRVIYREDILSISLKHKGIIPEVDKTDEFGHSITVDKIMTKKFISVKLDDKIDQVIELMNKTSYKGFPILENQTLVGIITSSDFLGISQLNKDQPIKSLISFNNVISIVPECPVLLAFVIMNRYNINRLPVVNDIVSRKLVGIVTRSDLNRANKNYGLLKVLNKFEETFPDSDFIVQLNAKDKRSNT